MVLCWISGYLVGGAVVVGRRVARVGDDVLLCVVARGEVGGWFMTGQVEMCHAWAWLWKGD